MAIIYLIGILQHLQNLQIFAEFSQKLLIFQTDFCENFEIAAVQKYANLVELEKCCRTHIFLQIFVLIQPRTSPPKIRTNLQKNANFAYTFRARENPVFYPGDDVCGARREA